MITIASIAVFFDLDVDVAKRNQVANAAFDLAEQSAREFLPVDEFGIETVVERGSIEVFVTVVLTVPTLLTALSTYGSAAEGLDRLKADVKAMKRHFVKELPRRAQLPDKAFEASRLTMEELAKINRFVKDVERGKLAPEEGAKQACAELELVDEPLDKQTKRQLEKSFAAIAPVPKIEGMRRPSATGHRQRDELRAAPPAIRRRLKKPKRRDSIRIWRNPGESKKNREEP
jgi:hypothetical protein